MKDGPVVLYVDDEESNLRVFTANFAQKLPVLTCQSSLEALEILRRHGPTIAVLLTDQRMPDISGVELLEKGRELAPLAKRMVITAYSDADAVIQAVNRGQVSRYFVKPWNREDLLGALESAMEIFKLEGQLADFESRMRQAERLATIGQVSVGVAHELMNPVAYISQNVASLQREFTTLERHLTATQANDFPIELRQTLEDVPQLLADVQRGAEHILAIATNLRGQARDESNESECDLAAVASFAVKLARPQVSGRARISMAGGATRLPGSPVRLCQVLLNLLVNAAQAMSGKEPGLIEIHWVREGDRVQITVQDNGPGISPDLVGRVFEPFVSSKASGKGSGLGLTICRDLVTRLGGTISLSSKLGHGTRVEISLPAKAEG